MNRIGLILTANSQIIVILSPTSASASNTTTAVRGGHPAALYYDNIYSYYDLVEKRTLLLLIKGIRRGEIPFPIFIPIDIFLNERLKE